MKTIVQNKAGSLRYKEGDIVTRADRTVWVVFGAKGTLIDDAGSVITRLEPNEFAEYVVHHPKVVEYMINDSGYAKTPDEMRKLMHPNHVKFLDEYLLKKRKER